MINKLKFILGTEQGINQSVSLSQAQKAFNSYMIWKLLHQIRILYTDHKKCRHSTAKQMVIQRNLNKTQISWIQGAKTYFQRGEQAPYLIALSYQTRIAFSLVFSHPQTLRRHHRRPSPKLIIPVFSEAECFKLRAYILKNRCTWCIRGKILWY